MAEGKNKVIWYTNWGKTFLKLSDDEAGKLIKHFSAYVLDQDPEASDRLTELLFDPIKDTLKRDLQTYNEKRQINKKNGAKGGRPRKTQKNPEKPNGYFENPEKPVKDKDKDKDKDNVTVNDKSKVYDQAVHNTCKVCLRYFPEHLHPKNQSQKNNWLDTVDKLHRIDGIPYDTICEIVKWAREDEFWSGNFLSITKLRKKNKDQIPYIVVFNEKIKSNGTKKSRRQQITEHNRRTAEELGLL